MRFYHRLFVYIWKVRTNINTQIFKKKNRLKNISLFTWTTSSYSVVYHWKQKHNLFYYISLCNIHQVKKKKRISIFTQPAHKLNIRFHPYLCKYSGVHHSFFYQRHIMNSRWWILMTIEQLLVCVSSVSVLRLSIVKE